MAIPPADVISFVQKYNLNFSVWLDPTYQASDHAFKTMNLPSSYVIDRNGAIRLEWFGAISAQNLRSMLHLSSRSDDMKAKVTWQKELQFVGVAESGFPIKLDSHSSPETGAGPVEMVAIALAGCTAMDVISILVKKKLDVTGFEVKVNADRSSDHPKRYYKSCS